MINGRVLFIFISHWFLRSVTERVVIIQLYLAYFFLQCLISPRVGDHELMYFISSVINMFICTLRSRISEGVLVSRGLENSSI